jgi:hypothetical protein
MHLQRRATATLNLELGTLNLFQPLEHVFSPVPGAL